MKYFKKTTRRVTQWAICSILLLCGAVSVTFSQDMDTDDPVPPLGEGEEKLVAEKMDDNAIKQLADSFIDRAEAAYTKEYAAPEGFLDWLKENPKLRAAFWSALAPDDDDIEKAMEVLNELRKTDAKAVERFYHLAVAFAVVWDSPEAVEKSSRSCIGKVPKEQFGPLPNFVDNFKYFTAPKNQALFNFNPDKLAWPLLVHIVDMDLSQEEIDWGIKNYQNKRLLIGTFYDDLEYDKDKAADKMPKLGFNKYNLMNLLKCGGICGDQAHFASRLAKIFGTPGMKVSGEGRSGGGHAWVGYLEKRKDKLELVFAGRFFTDFYYTGDIFDPQTKTRILDRELALLYEGSNLDYNKFANSVILTRMSRGLATGKPELSVNLAANALQQNWFYGPAWLALVKHIENNALEQSKRAFWFNQMLTRLKKHPDIIIRCWEGFTRYLPKEAQQKRDLDYQAVQQILKAERRADLLIALALIQGNELCEKSQEAQALNLYLDAAYTYAGESTLILPLLERAVELTGKLNKVKDTIPTYERILQKIPPFRSDEISGAYQKAAGMLVGLYEAADMKDKAAKLRKTAKLKD